MTASILRVGYAALLMIYVSVWMIDCTQWFSDEGVVSAVAARQLAVVPKWSLLDLLPSTPPAITFYLTCLFVHAVLMLLGCWSRFQAACIFVWLVTFQHRNQLICDSEDTVFRLFAFFFMFLPLDHAWSIGRWLQGWPRSSATSVDAWAVRLVQIQMTLIYASAAWSKLQGSTWLDGTALYLVSRVTDLYGRFWVPSAIFETPWSVQLATWSVPAIEALLPLGLWYQRTRRWAIIAGITFHLAIEYSMNLFLFQWIMMVGLLAFAQPSNWRLHSCRSTPNSN